MSSSTAPICPSLEQLELFVSRPTDQPDVAEHVITCAPCRDQVDAIRQNNQLLKDLIKRSANPRCGELVLPAPSAIEGYEIISELRRGGQGVVFRALHKKTKREVALKMLLAGRAASPKQQRRFEREVELVASLRHPRIVTLYDSGRTSDGGHYFAMEFVDGQPLDEYVQAPPRNATIAAKRDEPVLHDRLRLLCKICDAVQHAHQNGVIHRDLKPGNILVDADGEPHVLDFGVARALGRDMLNESLMTTRTGEFMGTFAYAAPEQISGPPDRVDTRADVYALGVIAYELLVGAPPYSTEGSISDVVHQITQEVPAPPSSRARSVNEELDTIVLKALSKERERRYPSVESLRRDVERFLVGEPIDAKRDSTWYVFKKMARRYRGAFAVAAAFVIIITGFALSMAFFARRARDDAHRLAQMLNALRIEQGRSTAAAGDAGLGEEALWTAHLNPPPDWESEPTQELVSTAGPESSYWALWELYSRAPCLSTGSIGVSGAFSISGDASLAIAVDSTGKFDLWNLVEHRHERTIYSGPRRPVLSMCYDGSIVAFCQPSGCVTVLRTSDGTVLRTIEREETAPVQAILSADGSLLALCGPDGSIQISTVADGRSVAELRLGAGDNVLMDPERAQYPSADFSRDNKTLAIAFQNRLEAWSLVSGTLLRKMLAPNLDSRFVTFSADGRSVAGAFNAAICVMNLHDETRWRYSHGGRVSAVRFSPDGHWLASTGLDGALKLVRSESPHQERSYLSARRWGSLLAFSPHSRTVTVGHIDGTFRTWETDERPHLRRLTDSPKSVLALKYSNDGQWLAVAGGGRFHSPDEWLIDVRDAATGAIVRRLAGHGSTVSSLAFDRRGARLASSSQDGTAKLWDVATGDCLRTVSGHEGIVSSVAISGDGRLLATGGEDNRVILWNTENGEPLHTFVDHDGRIPEIRFSPDDRLLASVGTDGRVAIRDVAARRTLRVMREDKRNLRSLCFTPDGKTLAAAGDDGVVRIWDVQSGALRRSWEAHGHGVFSIAFHRDGRMLASGGRGTDIKLWNAASGRCLLTLEGHEAEVFSLQFHPSGQQLASGGADDSVAIWDLAHYNAHIAGNLEFELRQLANAELDPTAADRLRRWAAGR